MNIIQIDSETYINTDNIEVFHYDEKIDHTLNISFTSGRHSMLSGETGKRMFNALMSSTITPHFETIKEPK